MSDNLPLLASAILVWLPDCQRPDIRSFDPSKLQPPPHPNPEAFWVLHEAITHAVETHHLAVEKAHDKVPWVKVGDRIMGPEEILRIYKGMGNLKGFASHA
ncbi:hypothetical protein [Roseicella frigidaeris]|uniref:hypothetical protein n=1 Tax=Roseicella frigidaeris TaxID=2230885 RepID=UPI000FDD2148|nr:hypothetical protein [Roseicella frigidaeris]